MYPWNLRSSQKMYFVASDYNGTPLEIFDEKADSINQIQRSPWGLILNEINPDFFLPIGFHSELEIHGIVLFNRWVKLTVRNLPTKWLLLKVTKTLHFGEENVLL